MLLSSLMVLALACLLLAAFRAHYLRRSAVKVRIDKD
jgi:hypothetical protein